MSETWAPKTDPIEVMFCTAENLEEVRDWISPLIPVDNVIMLDWGNVQMYDEANACYLIVYPGQYVYLDEDGFHTADIALFKMLYKKVEVPS